MNYKINFVNDEDFENLPGNDMGSKVGVAYPKYGEAYVRKSGVSVVDVFSAMHELEHLEGSDRGEKFDLENQCYYKSFQDVLSPILGIGGSLFGGPIGGAVGSGVGQLFGGNGGKSLGQQAEPQMEALEAPMGVQAPFTSQAQGGGGNIGGGNAGGNAIKSLSQQPQFGDIEKQRYGNISGRSPLMSVFGGQ